MNDYQKEELEALEQISQTMVQLKPDERIMLSEMIEPYLSFRRKLDAFLSGKFSDHCTSSCYQNNLSACCSKDGIITFWADAVINLFCSSKAQIQDVYKSLKEPWSQVKCTYLTPGGCCWKVRPLVCAMFICDSAQKNVFGKNAQAKTKWRQFERTAKSFRWPDKIVLFDSLERCFMEKGCRSSLMHLNTSPGLLNIKKKYGVKLY
ncbi:MAG: hypothetical protein GY874_00565 [Desulfobacteraceae bacterium]|nr:hypothetical protein [Desulfobacteraceae bacterium]